ncbi:23S rRNA (adenine(2503)-C(2))-methyltransferase RlmN [uncultured Varibaculum sp.]|uniref:23S rRNA (adenine(2503)-C(2))-methyltransferase RlmN n=1 Tax=uncultured Varibaculum sp. TaxID=413896 RepID=UPI0026749A71|nr:23S rRNA (adenine(2503)-C(2))-methyltransferase RlmN [uncultured Varibaculum sp.]
MRQARPKYDPRQVMPTDQPPEGATSSDARPVLRFQAIRRTKPTDHLADFDLAGRKKFLKNNGFPPFRADQLSRHYFTHLTTDCAQMTDLPALGREKLTELAFPPLIEPVLVRSGDNGMTRKYLWRLFDGAEVESVLMRYPSRATLCISCEVGCGMACPFCATGQMGLTRNLSTAEIVEQVRLARKACEEGELGGSSCRLSNVVFMGMGEPMVNYRAVLGAVRRLIANPPEGFGMSARGITVSTVGLVPGIKKLTEEKIPLTLAISLHAPDDELRDELIPLNSRFKVSELLDAAYQYFQATGRRVSIEYALIKNMNDQAWRAELLADLLNARGHGWAHVNPIPLNPTPGSIWTASESHAQAEFVDTLERKGITTTIRDTRGQDIDGACGQLATKSRKERTGK